MTGTVFELITSGAIVVVVASGWAVNEWVIDPLYKGGKFIWLKIDMF